MTEGVNFTNVLRTAFTLVYPESVKNTVKSQVFFELLVPHFFAVGLKTPSLLTYNLSFYALH